MSQPITAVPKSLWPKCVAELKKKGRVFAVAQALGLTDSSLRRAYRMMESEGYFNYKQVVQEHIDRNAQERLARQLAAKQKEQAFRKQVSAEMSAKKQEESAQAQLEQVKQLMALPSKRHAIPVYKPHHGEAIPVLMLSDLHAEERVKPGDVAGCDNVYNPEVFKRRLAGVFARSLYMTQTLRHMAAIDSMCVWLGGDLISGHIHEDLSESNYMSPIRACELVKDEIGSGIEHLLKHGKFKKLIIPCNWGNHGRTTEKSRVQTGADNSFEYWLYLQMAREWRNEKRVEFHIAEGYQLHLRLFDTLIRFHHGDAINYGGGVGGITIPVLKAIANWNTIQKADIDCFGHFHQFMDGGRFVANGSLIGYGAYALKVKAAYEAPQQAYFLVDRKRGKSLTARIFAE